MRRIKTLAIVVLLFIFLLSCSILSVDNLIGDSISPNVETQTPHTQPADDVNNIPALTVRDIRFIETSTIADDPTIWVFLPSGQIAQSDDHAESWVIVFGILPGYDIRLMRPDESMEFTKTDHGLYFAYNEIVSPMLWYTESTTWDVIKLPEGAKSVAVAQDGSSRVIASGANPKGVENAWILESPKGKWLPISCEIDNWASIITVDWLPQYGIVGINGESTVLHADENYNWEVVGTLETSLIGGSEFWVASDDLLYLDTSMHKLKWTGEKFEEYESIMYEHLGTIPGVADFGRGSGFVKTEDYNTTSDDTGFEHKSGFVRTEDGGLTVEFISIPDMPDRIDNIDLAVSGDDIVYLLNEAGLYMSSDGGITWQMIIKN